MSKISYEEWYSDPSHGIIRNQDDLNIVGTSNNEEVQIICDRKWGEFTSTRPTLVPKFGQDVSINFGPKSTPPNSGASTGITISWNNNYTYFIGYYSSRNGGTRKYDCGDLRVSFTNANALEVNNISQDKTYTLFSVGYYYIKTVCDVITVYDTNNISYNALKYNNWYMILNKYSYTVDDWVLNLDSLGYYTKD